MKVLSATVFAAALSLACGRGPFPGASSAAAAGADPLGLDAQPATAAEVASPDFAPSLVPEAGSSAAAAAAPDAQSTGASSADATDAGDALGAAATTASATDSKDDMLFVPSGPFTMGADAGGQEDEHPAHVVTLAGYWLDRTEVTNRAYGQCVAAGVCRAHDPASATLNRLGGDAPFRGPEQPVSSISWDDAKTYCEHLGERLPTEAEWEKAARGTDARRYPWGDTLATHEMAVFEAGRTADVGTHPEGAGPFGHLDLAGNVWEWVADIYDPYAYRRPTAGEGLGGTCEETLAALKELRDKGRQGFTGSNPIPTECERVLRGGAFNYDGNGLRSSNRVHHPGRFRLIMSGFRCAKDGEPTAAR